MILFGDPTFVKDKIENVGSYEGKDSVSQADLYDFVFALTSSVSGFLELIIMASTEKSPSRTAIGTIPSVTVADTQEHPAHWMKNVLQRTKPTYSATFLQNMRQISSSVELEASETLRTGSRT